MLADTAVRNAKPREKPCKLTDGGGLYVIVNPNGSRWWRFRYRVQGREKLISLGVHPEILLREARERRDEAKKLHKSGVDRRLRPKEFHSRSDETSDGVSEVECDVPQLRCKVQPYARSELLDVVLRYGDRKRTPAAFSRLSTRFRLRVNEVERSATVRTFP